MEEKIPVPIAEYYMIFGPALFDPRSLESEIERLAKEFEAHESGERQFIQRYKEIAARTKNPLVKFLLGLIISDEEKHHAVTHAMVTTLKADLSWTSPEGTLRGLGDWREEKDELLKPTEDFIRLEREGIKVYKEFIKASEGYYRGLFALLFQSMMHDSEKHVKLLEFLRNQLGEA